jgi:hypothetical protein
MIRPEAIGLRPFLLIEYFLFRRTRFAGWKHLLLTAGEISCTMTGISPGGIGARRRTAFSPGKTGMYQILFIVSLFILVFLALGLEYFLAPNVVFLILGGASLIFGIILFGYGNFRKKAAPAGKPGVGSIPVSTDKTPKGSSACLPAVVGGMYVLIGAGMLILQIVGHQYLK